MSAPQTVIEAVYTGGEEPEVSDVIVPYNYAIAANPSVVRVICDDGWLRIARIEINVDGLPTPKGSKTAFVVKGRAVVTDVPHKGANRNSAAVWRESIAANVRTWLERNGRPEPLDGPLRLELHFRLPRPATAPKRVTLPAKKPDADKLCRFAADVLSGLLYVDDARIVDLIVTKRFASGEPPGVRIVVEPVL